MILTDFDNSPSAIINPQDNVNKIQGIPKTALSLFNKKMFDDVLSRYPHEEISQIVCSTSHHPVYRLNYLGNEITIVQAGLGAPYCTALIEELYAMGVENLLLFGSCGSLIPDKNTNIFIPTAAIRDEGTSFHYLPPSDEIQLNPILVKKLKDFFDSKNIPTTLGKTWTTDGFYRETKNKFNLVLKLGAISVDMECSAIAALSKFRKKNFAQFLYTGDILSEDNWDIGTLSDEHDYKTKQKIVDLALECACQIFNT